MNAITHHALIPFLMTSAFTLVCGECKNHHNLFAVCDCNALQTLKNQLQSITSLAWPAPSLKEEGSGALSVHELFYWNAVTAHLLVHNAVALEPQL